MVFSELLPDAQEALTPDEVAMVTTVSAALFEGFRMSLDWVSYVMIDHGLQCFRRKGHRCLAVVRHRATSWQHAMLKNSP